MAASGNGTLKAPTTRFNLRGVRRLYEGSVRFYIAVAEPTTYTATVSKSVGRLLLGFCDVQGDVVIPASTREVIMCPLLGLAVERSNGAKTAVHKAIVMVRGSQKSTMDR